MPRLTIPAILTPYREDDGHEVRSPLQLRARLCLTGKGGNYPRKEIISIDWSFGENDEDDPIRWDIEIARSDLAKLFRENPPGDLYRAVQKRHKENIAFIKAGKVRRSKVR